MAEGRRIQGDDFVENMQDYVEERLTETTDTREFGVAERALEQEAADLRQIAQGNTSQDSVNDDALAQEAQLPASSMELRPDPADLSLDATIDPRQQPPQAEARSRVTDDLNDAAGQGNIRP